MTARRKPRRRFSKELKREAVKVFRDSGKNITSIARELGVRPNVLRSWVDLVEAEEKTGLSPEELEELRRLRKENARLKEEVEILGKSDGLLRKPKAVRFAFIKAEKARS